MKILHDLTMVPTAWRGGAVTIGNFDGVHRGHELLLNQLKALAAEVDGPAIVFTFDPHPLSLLRPEIKVAPLTTTAAKVDRLLELGIDHVLVYPTDAGLLQLSAQDFFQQVLVEKLGARGVVEGSNFRFGHARGGDVNLLAQLAGQARLALRIVDCVQLDGVEVSSSQVRKALLAGQVEVAAQLMGRPYRVAGTVVRGAGRGTGIGFPTANVGEIATLLPAAGVYAGLARRGEQVWGAAINLGPNPTFGEDALKLEVHLLDASLDLYGQPLEVTFLAQLRTIQKFAGLAALQAQLQLDVAAARQIAAAARV